MYAYNDAYINSVPLEPRKKAGAEIETEIEPAGESDSVVYIVLIFYFINKSLRQTSF